MSSWQDIAANKRKAAYNLIPEAWRLPNSMIPKADNALSVMNVPAQSGILTKDELEITEKHDAVSLVQKLASRQLSAVEVITAFSKRAAIAQQLVNCLTETFFDEALDRAKYLDDYLAKEGKALGPLHGLPISIKDSFKVKGHEATLGYVSWVGTSETTNSALVDLFLDLGAIIYVKTNIPQTLMTADSDNNVFGRTLNPHNLTLNAGGSSGGEGALVAMRGSILGVGTDIGGSIRIPALCCGTYGFKPTANANRVPYGGQANPGAAGSPGIIPCAGPLATSFRDLEFFMKTVTGGSPWNYDAKTLFLPWRSTAAKKTLTIGILPADPLYPYTPPVARAVSTSAKKLQEAGHNVVYLDSVPSVETAMTLSGHMFSLDNTKTWKKFIDASGEPIVPSILGTHFEHQDSYALEDLFKLNVERSKCYDEWKDLYVKNKLDVILGPGAETTAVPHDTYGIPPYTVLWNLLDYPSAIIPYLNADKNIDTEHQWPKGATRTYNAEIVDGAPVCVQITARHCQDEECLAAAAVIAEVLLEGKPVNKRV